MAGDAGDPDPVPRPRPSVSVIVPFGGGAEAAAGVVESLRALVLGPDDEAIVVDNSRGGEDRLAGAPARVVRADAVRSSYHARNRGAAEARGEWLLFLDADCRPDPRLIDEYLAAPRADSCGAVAGAVLPAPGQEGLLTRYARSRGYLDQRAFMSGPGRPFAATANLLVRRAAWEQLGGFSEVRSAGDVDFCWRLQDAGWSLELEEAARVEHRHRDTLGGAAAAARALRRRPPLARAPAPRGPQPRSAAPGARAGGAGARGVGSAARHRGGSLPRARHPRAARLRGGPARVERAPRRRPVSAAVRGGTCPTQK